MQIKRRAIWVVLGVLFTVSACAAGTSGSQDDFNLDALDERARELTLDVENQNFYDAELYAVASGTATRQRLGYVRAYSKEVFTFPWVYASELRIEINLVSVGRYFTPPMPVEQGDELRLVVEPDLHRKQPAGIPRVPGEDGRRR